MNRQTRTAAFARLTINGIEAPIESVTYGDLPPVRHEAPRVDVPAQRNAQIAERYRILMLEALGAPLGGVAVAGLIAAGADPNPPRFQSKSVTMGAVSGRARATFRKYASTL